MNLHYINQGQGVPFVFQHGLSANILQSKKLFDNLPDIQLISLDCPGHGQSPYPTHQNPSFDFYADQVLQLLDQLSIEKVILGGLSMGSGIALNIARRFPERIKALVLLRPAWLDQTCPENLRILLSAASLMKSANGQTLFSQNEQFQKIQDALPAAAASLLGVFDNSQQKELNQVLEFMVNDRPFSNLEDLKTIEQSTIIIANNNDPLHPFSMAKTLNQYLPNSNLYKVISRYLNDDLHGKEVRKLVGQFITELNS
jgi:pimeloyl-ACP methyl ester carboxylesterase